MSESKAVVTVDDISEANAPAIYVKGGLLQFLEAVKVEVTAKAREADRAHKGATLKAAKEAIMKAGITEEQAVAVVKVIAAGKVPAVSIQY